jgi:hypothetical protein
MRTYDQIQLGAVRTWCTVCWRWLFMTQPQAICVRCRQAQAKAEA